MITGEQVLEQARTLIGRPWAHQGRGQTVDCAGVVVLTAQSMGLSGHDVRGYSRRPDGHSLRQALVDAGCTPGAMSVGAVALMRWAGEPTHLGFFGRHPSGGWSLLHGYSVAGKVVEHIIDGKWLRRIDSVWHLPGVEA